MMPAIIAKSVDNSKERWKVKVSLPDENSKILPGGDFPQSFMTIDGNVYCLPAEIMTGFPSNGIAEPFDNGHVNIPPPQSYPQVISLSDINKTDVVQQGDNATTELSVDELKRLIQVQFEYYFSRENLANDSYLMSQMDSDQYVYISTVARFNQIRKLTSNMDLIVEALRESPHVQLDETGQKVRAITKRCIVILREIPESTPVEELEALLVHPTCPKCVSFEFAHNDSWYLTFESEEDAKKAYHYLHEEVKYFHGRPLMARIKAQTLLSRAAYRPKSASTLSSVTVTSTTTPSISTTQYNTVQQPLATFIVPPNVVIHQPHTLPFYTSTPINRAPVIPGTWITPRHTSFFIQPDMLPKNLSTKQKISNAHLVSNKGSEGNRNNIRAQRSSNSGPDTEEPRNQSMSNRHQHSDVDNEKGMSTSSSYKKESGRFSRVNMHGKKDFRPNGEGGNSRYQRLREKQQKESLAKATEKEPPVPENNNLQIDLAMENFPALPSPNSPNEGNNNRCASSLKELAKSALESSVQASTKEVRHTTNIKDGTAMGSDKAPQECVTSEAPSNGAIHVNSPKAPSAIAPPPKISYAQMAQKPNNKSKQEQYEGDKIMPDHSDLEALQGFECASKCNDDNAEKAEKNYSCVAKTQNKDFKEPLKQQEILVENLQDCVIEKPNETNTDDSNSNHNDTSKPQRETYASKFVKANVTTTKSQVVVNQDTCKASSSSTSIVNSKEGPPQDIPSPKPLEDQVEVVTPLGEKSSCEETSNVVDSSDSTSDGKEVEMGKTEEEKD